MSLSHNKILPDFDISLEPWVLSLTPFSRQHSVPLKCTAPLKWPEYRDGHISGVQIRGSSLYSISKITAETECYNSCPNEKDDT